MCDIRAMVNDAHTDDLKGFKEFQEALRDRLKALRLENGHTQLDMAESGMSTRQYERFEQNSESINSLKQLYRLAQFYGLSVTELLNTEKI